jgi:hypothetical protein
VILEEGFMCTLLLTEYLEDGGRVNRPAEFVNVLEYFVLVDLLEKYFDYGIENCFPLPLVLFRFRLVLRVELLGFFIAELNEVLSGNALDELLRNRN